MKRLFARALTTALLLALATALIPAGGLAATKKPKETPVPRSMLPWYDRGVPITISGYTAEGLYDNATMVSVDALNILFAGMGFSLDVRDAGISLYLVAADGKAEKFTAFKGPAVSLAEMADVRKLRIRIPKQEDGGALWYITLLDILGPLSTGCRYAATNGLSAQLIQMDTVYAVPFHYLQDLLTTNLYGDLRFEMRDNVWRWAYGGSRARWHDATFLEPSPNRDGTMVVRVTNLYPMLTAIEAVKN
ncbi:MAG: hypothetical protein LBU67_06610 [Oscillospiraceae bacterium]|jgi:hypothetical protein|nr:hypothetical protein [Oscillospiraceae bacterium]